MNIGSANVSTYICFKLMDAWGKMDFFYCKVSIYHIICQCHLGPYVISQLERHLLVDLLHVRKALNTLIAVRYDLSHVIFSIYTTFQIISSNVETQFTFLDSLLYLGSFVFEKQTDKCPFLLSCHCIFVRDSTFG